jgi:hypothetical protein
LKDKVSEHLSAYLWGIWVTFPPCDQTVSPFSMRLSFSDSLVPKSSVRHLCCDVYLFTLTSLLASCEWKFLVKHFGDITFGYLYGIHYGPLICVYSSQSISISSNLNHFCVLGVLHSCHFEIHHRSF